MVVPGSRVTTCPQRGERGSRDQGGGWEGAGRCRRAAASWTSWGWGKGQGPEPLHLPHSSPRSL